MTRGRYDHATHGTSPTSPTQRTQRTQRSHRQGSFRQGAHGGSPKRQASFRQGAGSFRRPAVLPPHSRLLDESDTAEEDGGATDAPEESYRTKNAMQDLSIVDPSDDHEHQALRQAELAMRSHEITSYRDYGTPALGRSIRPPEQRTQPASGKALAKKKAELAVGSRSMPRTADPNSAQPFSAVAKAAAKKANHACKLAGAPRAAASPSAAQSTPPERQRLISDDMVRSHEPSSSSPGSRPRDKAALSGGATSLASGGPPRTKLFGGIPPAHDASPPQPVAVPPSPVAPAVGSSKASQSVEYREGPQAGADEGAAGPVPSDVEAAVPTFAPGSASAMACSPAAVVAAFNSAAAESKAARVGAPVTTAAIVKTVAALPVEEARAASASPPKRWRVAGHTVSAVFSRRAAAGLDGADEPLNEEEEAAIAELTCNAELAA